MALFSLFIAKAAVGKTDASASIGEISTKNAEQFNLMKRLSTLENVMSDPSSDGSTGDGMRTETENPLITWIDWQKETQKSQPHDSEHPRENVLDYDNHDSFPKEQYHDHTHDHTYEHSSEHSSEDSTDFVNNDVSDSYPTEDGPFSSDGHRDDGSQYLYPYETYDYDTYEPSSGGWTGDLMPGIKQEPGLRVDGHYDSQSPNDYDYENKYGPSSSVQIDHDYEPKDKIQCSPAIQHCCLPQAKGIGSLCRFLKAQLEDCCQMSLPPQRKVDDYHYDDSEAKHPEDHDSKYSYDNSLDSTSSGYVSDPMHENQCSAIQHCCLPQAKGIGSLCRFLKAQLEDCCQMSLPPQRKDIPSSRTLIPGDHSSWATEPKEAPANYAQHTENAMIKDNIMLEQRLKTVPVGSIKKTS